MRYILYIFSYIVTVCLMQNNIAFAGKVQHNYIIEDLMKITDPEKNKQRDKSLFEIGFGVLFQYSNLSFKNPSGGSILRWNNLQNFGPIGYIRWNTTSRLWFKFSAEGAFITSGNAIDDDISNGAGIISIQKPMGYNYELKAVTGIDILHLTAFDVALYGGWFYKHFRYSMGSGVARANNTTQYFNIQEDQISKITLNGATIGLNCKYYHSPKILFDLSLEMYILKFSFTGSWIQRNFDWSMSSDRPALGFGLIASTEIELFKKLKLKPFLKYQLITARINKEYFAGNLIYSGSYTGNFNYSALYIGIMLIWK